MYAKASEVKVGDQLKADGGFACIKEGAILTVKVNERQERYVDCDGGHHGLAGQVDGDEYTGFTKV
jgi:hypothetical protein